jgi:hypothetical protein
MASAGGTAGNLISVFGGLELGQGEVDAWLLAARDAVKEMESRLLGGMSLAECKEDADVIRAPRESFRQYPVPVPTTLTDVGLDIQLFLQNAVDLLSTALRESFPKISH